MFAMQNTSQYASNLPDYLAKEVPQLEQVITEFKRRGGNKEFSANSLLVYINFSAAVA